VPGRPPGGTGETPTKEQLGGSRVHARNAAVDLIAASEAEAFALIRRFLSYLPQGAYQLPPVAPCADPAGRRDDALLSAVPRDRRQPYRIRPILAAVFDAGSVLEAQRYGGSVVTALARLDGHPVGVVAGDPYISGGCLTVEGGEAVTRLADLCSTFHLPIGTPADARRARTLPPALVERILSRPVRPDRPARRWRAPATPPGAPCPGRARG